MRWARLALVLCAATTSCQFSVRGVDGGGGGVVDLGVDLAGVDGPPCACATGCSSGPTPHCLALQPTGPVSASDYEQPGLAAISPNGDIVINTDLGTISGAITRSGGTGVVGGIGFRVAPQSGSASVGVFSVAGLTLKAGAKITLRGTNAFALASSADVTIDGFVDGACSGTAPGPGGFAGGMGSNPGLGMGGGGAGQSAAGAASGGGGGGYGDSGGAGGGLLTTSNAGVIWGDLRAPMFRLVGGAGGGPGGANGGDGGDGGGAVQLAVNGTLTVRGVIDVGGCGGRQGGKGKGGGGGGAGGAIVLEAAHVTLIRGSVLAANGGGGGGGDDMSMPGAPANPSVTPAIGGTTNSVSGGDGGAGGASNGMPGQRFTHGRDGLLPLGATFGGGGGGGCGRIAVRAPNHTGGGITDDSIAVTPDAADLNTPLGLHFTFYDDAIMN
jgi:hypothetical protein